MIDPAIAQGRAYIRIMESAMVLLCGDIDEDEKVIIRQVARLSGQRLRTLVAKQSPEVVAQILIASDKIMALAGSPSLN
jgi:hypothetical protein